jgi:hypothetical protein
MSNETVGEVELEAEGKVLEAEEAAPETPAEVEPLLGVADEGPGTVAEVELQAEGEALAEFIDRRHTDPFAPHPPEGYVEHPDREHVYVHPDLLVDEKIAAKIEADAGKKKGKGK